MIWQNRGKELALFEAKLKEKRNIVFYGLSWEVPAIYERLSFLKIDFAFTLDKYCGENLRAIKCGGGYKM